jgi:hypothetical protein
MGKMGKMMKLVSWYLLGALAFSGCGKSTEAAADDVTQAAAGDAGGGRAIDLTDNKVVEEICIQALNAYRDKNLQKLAELGPEKAKESLIFLEDERNPNRQTLLGDDTWRMKSLREWNNGPHAGKLVKIVRGLDNVAQCHYFEDATHNYYMEVRKDADKWRFFDLGRKPKEGVPADPPLEPAKAPPMPGMELKDPNAPDAQPAPADAAAPSDAAAPAPAPAPAEPAVPAPAPK